MPIRYLILITLSGFVVSLDQVTKLYIASHFEEGKVEEVISGFLSLTYKKNIFGVFDLFHNIDPTIRTSFFLLVPALFLLITLLIFIFKKNIAHMPAIGLALISGGALGNLIDRIRFNSVIGFIRFEYLPKKHPMNVGDVFLCLGGVLLILYIIFFMHMDTNNEKQI